MNASSRNFLQGKIALVTGASKGLGAGIARVLAGYGAKVAVHYKSDRAGAETVARMIVEQGGVAALVAADVTRREEVEKMVREVADTLGPIDLLINNAGHNPLRPITETTEEGWDEVLSLNLKSYYLMTKAVLPQFLARGCGMIVNISSISGQRGGNSCDVDYSAAKAGILGFTRSLAKWAAPKGIRVNAIAPGYIDTDNLRLVAPEKLEALKKTIPLGRFATPEEIGEVTAFLCGPGASYLIGEVITANGGVHMD